MKVEPARPCLQQSVTIQGRKFRNARRVAVWLVGPDSGTYDQRSRRSVDHVYGGIKVGEMVPDELGDCSLTFTLAPRLGPVTSGGDLVLTPGQWLQLTIVSDNPDLRTIDTSLTVADASGPCPSVSMPPSLRLSLEPAFPCHGETVRLRGENFEGREARLTFKHVFTRFYYGTASRQNVPVAADGSFELAFKPEDINGGSLFSYAGARYFISAFDPNTNRSISIPVPFCNAPLRQALNAKTIALGDGVTGNVQLHGPKQMAKTLETTVIRSPGDWSAVSQRTGFPQEVFNRIPRPDFNTELGLLVLQRPSGSTRRLEIVAVEQTASGYLVHMVGWQTMDPMFGDWTFDFVTIPRTDKPITFADVAYGWSEDRLALKPGLAQRRPAYLSARTELEIEMRPGR